MKKRAWKSHEQVVTFAYAHAQVAVKRLHGFLVRHSSSGGSGECEETMSVPPVIAEVSLGCAITAQG